MLLVYTPENGERQQYVFRPLEINNRDAEDIEDVGGNTWDDFSEFDRAFHQGKTKALRAALWISLRGVDPSLGFDDVQFKISEVDVFLEQEERQRIRDRLGDGSLTDSQAEQAKAVLAAQPDDEPVGKDEPVDTDTSST